MAPIASLLLLCAAPAQAGDLLIETDTAAEVQLGTTTLLRTWGPARLRVVEVDPGLASVRVIRGERTDLLDVLVPDTGAARVRIGPDGLSTEPIADEAAWPVLELRAAAGQRFGVVLDGDRLAVIGHQHPVRVEGITAGEHALELRTADLTVVWSRATLDLAEDDMVVVTGQEGYAPLVSARDGAFQLTGAATKKDVSTGSGG